METADRNKRVVEILTRKDELAALWEEHMAQVGRWVEEGHTLDSELQELIGTPAQVNSNGERKQMACGTCEQKGHNIKGHDKWVKANPDHEWVKANVKEA